VEKDVQLDIAAMQAAAARSASLLKVLGNPDRLILLCFLTQGEYCVSELIEISGIVQPTLSQQLAVLREEQLVSTRREGKQIYYSINESPALAVMQVLYEQFCAPREGAPK
jgi:ArsR family transcriptional regulator